VLLGYPLAPVEKETSTIEQFRVLLERRMTELVLKAEELAKTPTQRGTRMGALSKG